MLTRALYLSVGWFALSLGATLLAGHRLRRAETRLSLIVLGSTLILGDIIALVLFRNPLEVFLLSCGVMAFGWFWVLRLPDWNALGQVTWAASLLATGLFILYAFLVTAFSPLNPLSFLFALTFFFLETITLSLALAHLHESLDVLCRIRWRRMIERVEPVPGYSPMVSLHVPAYNEPAELVRRTLESLSALDYPNFEVLVVDNNTPAEATWRPLEAICRELGPRFHCLHLARWPGYKSGALNFALAQTDPHAEVIGIIDADYEVDPGFLRELVPAFADPGIAFIQTPQDYRDQEQDIFSKSMYRGYKYFFEISMPSRNERNAVIFAGTMGLLRKSVLQEIGGWDEWCITEDAEASLRILKRGYQSLYLNKSFGRGLMPFNFEGLKKQRFRWCFGGVQILKKHWETLMPWSHRVDAGDQLTLAQRYYYLVGGLGWFTDVFNLLFAFFLVLGAVFSILDSPLQIRPLTNTILILPAVFLLLHIWRFLWVLRIRLKIPFGLAVATMHNFFSLGWAVTLACIQGIVQKAGVFLRTPKSKTSSRTWHALRTTQWETSIGLVCVGTGLLAFISGPDLRTFTLCSLLIWQGSLYLAAPFYSLVSTHREAAFATETGDHGAPVLENNAARWAVGLVIGMVFALSVIRILPTPAQAPWYTRYLPADLSLSPVKLIGSQIDLTGTRRTLKPVMATIVLDKVNCRYGPSMKDPELTVLVKGQRLEIIGRSPDLRNTWWYVQLPGSDKKCWVGSSVARTVGPYEGIPIIR